MVGFLWLRGWDFLVASLLVLGTDQAKTLAWSSLACAALWLVSLVPACLPAGRFEPHLTVKK
ncbi:hypothetical protein EPN90_03930 [Patescibacteria group bacterium]|nr:MAG: hypothetical protein EPN90_03930 [Patescibacteria group bacterium]